LNLTVATCNWSLGEGLEARINKNEKELIAHPAIKNMMTELYPVLSKTQVKHLIADEIEHAFIAEMDNFEKNRPAPALKNLFSMFSIKDMSAEEKFALSRKGTEYNRCIYGYNKGKASDFLDALLSMIPDMYNAACYGFGKAKDYCFGTAASVAAAQEPAPAPAPAPAPR